MMYGGEMDYSGPRIFGASLRLFTAVPPYGAVWVIYTVLYTYYTIMAEAEQKPLSSRLSETLLSNPESEVSRWRRMFDRYAKEGSDGVKWVTIGGQS